VSDLEPPALSPRRRQVSGNWRLTFAFEKEDAILIDYQDYH
jgi:plasmid maintenance system killer protein